MANVSLAPDWAQHFHDDNGNPAAGWKVYVFESNTTTYKPSYSDPEGTILHAQPIELSDRGEYPGEGLFLLDGEEYTLELRDLDNVAIKTSNRVISSSISNIISNVDLQVAYDNGNEINTSVGDPVTITKGVPFQDNKIDSDGIVVQFYGQTSERRVSNTKVLNSDSTNTGDGRTSFHVEDLRTNYYEDAVNITDNSGTEQSITETNSKQTYSKVDDLTLSYNNVIRASDKKTTDTFNIKHEAFVRNDTNTNRIDVLDDYSLNGYKKNVNHEYNGQSNDDNFYQTIGQADRTRTISDGASFGKIIENLATYQNNKTDLVNSTGFDTYQNKTQFNNRITHDERVTRQDNGDNTKKINSQYYDSINEHNIVGPNSSDFNITQTETKFNLSDSLGDAVNLINTGTDGSLLREGVYATNGAIGSVTKTLTPIDEENVFLITGDVGQNFTCTPNLTTAGQLLKMPYGYIKSGFDYTIEVDLRSTPNLPTAFYFYSGIFIGSLPTPEAKQYLFSIHKTNTTIYIRDLTSTIGSDVEKLQAGIILDIQSISIVKDGGSWYAEIEKEGGGDLIVDIAGTNYLLNCTSGGGTGGKARSVVALTLGSATIPVLQYIYVRLNGAIPELMVGSSIDRTNPFANAGLVELKDDAFTLSKGALFYQRFNDSSVHGGDKRGLLSEMAERVRILGQQITKGIEASTVITPSAVALDSLQISTTAGVCYQMHQQEVDAYTPPNEYVVVNDPVSPFKVITDLNELTVDANGNSMHVNKKYYGLTFAVSVSSESQGMRFYVWLPTGIYSSLSNAVGDIYNYAGISSSIERRPFITRLARMVIKYTSDSSGTLSNALTGTLTQDQRNFSIGLEGGGGVAGSDYTRYPFIPQTTPPSPYQEGLLYFDSVQKRLVCQSGGDSNLSIGSEMWRRIYNGTGSIIPNGTVLNITGGVAEGSGYVGTVELADAISPAKLTELVISTQEIAIGAYGETVKIGDLNDLNTSSFSNGDIIYLSESTPGLITNVKPTTVGNYVCQIGIVYKVNATTGIIASCIKPPKVLGFTGSGTFTNFTYIDGTLIAAS